jgi:small subunit ribosomal protein S13
MAELQKIVRFMDTDLDGGLKTIIALKRIKGLGFSFARAACKKAGVEETKKIGELSSDEMKLLTDTITNPVLPNYMLNRQKDLETGKDIHISKIALDLKTREDINLLRRTKTYKGGRHEAGLPVRGQRTKGSFRTEKTVGVSKKAVKAAQAPKKDNKK